MLGNEGVRVGGVTATTASFIARADDTETVLIELFEDRNAERGSFAGSRPSLADHVFAIQSVRDQCGLNGRRGCESRVFDRSTHDR